MRSIACKDKIGSNANVEKQMHDLCFDQEDDYKLDGIIINIA